MRGGVAGAARAGAAGAWISADTGGPFGSITGGGAVAGGGPGGAGGSTTRGGSASSSSRTRQASRAPPSAYRISRSARRPGGPWWLRATVTALRCPTTSRPSRIQPVRSSSSRRPLASSTAAARPRPSAFGSTTTSSVPARLASAASRPSRSPTRTPLTAGSRPSGRSTTRRSTVRAESSAADRPKASSRSTGVSTTSHSGRIPRATASTGSKARARSSQATIEPVACASAASRRARVVLPDEASPRRATVVERGSPPMPRMASRAANPVGTTRPSGSTGCAGRGTATGASRVRPGAGRESGRWLSSGSSSGIGASASAPSTTRASSPPRRGATAPQRAWSVASASETSDARAIGRRILEQMFYCCKEKTDPCSACVELVAYPATASTMTPAPSSTRPSHCVGRGRSPNRQTA